MGRGCGDREPGGIYAEVPTSPNGKPVEAFLLDPPIRVPEGFGLPMRGAAVIKRPNEDPPIFDLYDRVGEEHYPNVQDMIEEVRRKGASRRLGTGTEFAQLGPGSRLILAHPRAVIGNAHDYYQMMAPDLGTTLRPRWVCVCGKTEHDDFADLARHGITCASLWRSDLTGGTLFPPEPLPDEHPDAPGERANWMECVVGDFAYIGRPRPGGINAAYHLGFFASFPLHRLVVINDPEGGKHEPNMLIASQANLPVELVDE